MYSHVNRRVINNHMEEQKRDSKVVEDFVALVDNGELSPHGVVRVKMEAMQPPPLVLKPNDHALDLHSIIMTTPPPPLIVRRSNVITSMPPSPPESDSSSTKTSLPPPPPPIMRTSHLGTPQAPPPPPPLPLRSRSLRIVIPHQVQPPLPPSPPTPPPLTPNGIKTPLPSPPPPPPTPGKLGPPPPALMTPRSTPPPPPTPTTPRSIPPPPPPFQQGKMGAPPPPPAVGPTRSLRAKPTTKLKRSSQMGSLYRLLKGKLEGSNLDGKSLKRTGNKIGAASNGNGKQGMADALAEMTRRSSYFIQIEEDVKNYANSIKEVKAALSSFQTTDMDALIKFHKYVESHMEKLTDETQVLARFEDFPSKKLEGLRMAAALYTKLDAIATTLQNWKIESPVSQLIDKVENYFNKVKQKS